MTTTFKLPKDYSVPEGVAEGTEFKDIATFRCDNGEITLLTIGEDECKVSDVKDKPKPKGAKQAIDEQLQQDPDKKLQQTNPYNS